MIAGGISKVAFFFNFLRLLKRVFLCTRNVGYTYNFANGHRSSFESTSQELTPFLFNVAVYYCFSWKYEFYGSTNYYFDKACGKHVL
uniref:Uncharacterized protein n=1 Tax=Rhipicephalus zambeziensis TaxID=60191 RepID=A0A224Y6C0_9ACAR